MRPHRPLAGIVLATSALLASAGGSLAGGSPEPTWSLGAPSPVAPPSWTPDAPSASHELVRDPFDAPGTWWIGTDEVGTNAIHDGGLRWTFLQDRRSSWDTQPLADPLSRVRVEAIVYVEDGSGGGGPVCAGDDAGTRSFWAGVNGDGQWLVGRIMDSHAQVTARGELLDALGDDAIGAPQPRLVTLECSIGTSGGSDKVSVWIDGVRVADMASEAVGPFTSAGLTASADQQGFSIRFDDFAVYDEPRASQGSPSPDPTDAG
jgi:hypothetical protein